MGSSNPNSLYDPVRCLWVARTPEEEIRQKLLARMIGELGYPKAFLAVEKALSALPHLRLTPKKEIPQRRADIVLFAKGDEGLFPLLMVECKAVPLTPKFAEQVLGYNQVVRAPFLTLANETEVLTGSFDEEAGYFRFKPGLPTYNEALAQSMLNASS